MINYPYLLGQWLAIHRDLDELDVSQLPRVLKGFADIVRMYRTPKRHYHTLEHIQATLRFVDANWSTKFYDTSTIAYVKMALFFHDCIYDVKRKDNEEQSGLVWMTYIRGTNLENDQVKQVFDLIMLTAKHEVTDDMPLAHQMMNDADMSIFLTEEDTYLGYARNIWREYQSFGREGYLQGRTAFLRTCNPESLFASPLMRSRVQRARTNLALEQRILQSNPDQLLC